MRSWIRRPSRSSFTPAAASRADWAYSSYCPSAALAVLADHRDAFLIAALAALGVLMQQVFVTLADNTPNTDYTAAGVLGVVLFGISLSLWPVANRLRESEALVRRQEVDLANLAQLSQYIVQHLRESILVIDSEDRIRLINESAAQILGDNKAYPDALLGEASPQLLYLLETWRQEQGHTGMLPGADPTFVSADGGYLVRATSRLWAPRARLPCWCSWKTRAFSPKKSSNRSWRPWAG